MNWKWSLDQALTVLSNTHADLCNAYSRQNVWPPIKIQLSEFVRPLHLLNVFQLWLKTFLFQFIWWGVTVTHHFTILWRWSFFYLHHVNGTSYWQWHWHHDVWLVGLPLTNILQSSTCPSTLLSTQQFRKFFNTSCTESSQVLVPS